MIPFFPPVSDMMLAFPLPPPPPPPLSGDRPSLLVCERGEGWPLLACPATHDRDRLASGALASPATGLDSSARVRFENAGGG